MLHPRGPALLLDLQALAEGECRPLAGSAFTAILPRHMCCEAASLLLLSLWLSCV